MTEQTLGTDSPHWSIARIGSRWRWTAITEESNASGWAASEADARNWALDTYGFLRRQEKADG